MTDERDRRRRLHPRRRAPVVRHTPPPPAQLPPPAEPVLTEEDPATAPPLSLERAQRLQELTDIWMRQARIAGAGPDATMFYAAPPPPPPPFRSERPDQEPPVPAEPLPAADQPRPDPAGPRLVRDWTSRHDPRSRNFDIAAVLTGAAPLQDSRLETGPIFDQGTTPPLSPRDASGCVGFAWAAAVNALDLTTGNVYVPAEKSPGLLTREDALALYDRAQALDHVSGTRPGGDPGTSVLAGALAVRERGYVAEFRWAFGTRQIARALLYRLPVVLGLPWGPSLDDPDADGVIAPAGRLEQGHAVCAVRLRRMRGAWHIGVQQSRGPGHGDRGIVYLHHADLSRLLAGVGEACVPVPPWGIA